ncbi:uncharacterized protein LOC108674499 [Hyalella azteca]|uniref:Uncharacterized protein LOC108674499 n=1 Tax=Hyalella azteca TaxID=294128 RepID=A0A8B7NYJ3_HYAAZ|nr:uncharacterized protein LOC108674499 [Hyalella azteca]
MFLTCIENLSAPASGEAAGGADGSGASSSKQHIRLGGQLRLWGYKFPDLTSQIAPLTIDIVDLPLLVTKEEIAKKFHIAQDYITLKRKRDKKSASAIIVAPSWRESDKLLGDHNAVFFGKHKAFLRQSYDSDASRPSSELYKPHKLSSEKFDLSPASSGQPTLHVLNDDILFHILKNFNVQEKLMLEAGKLHE